jgi:hypothetical protein
MEIRLACGVAGNAGAIVLDAEAMTSLFPGAGDRDVAGAGVDAVFDELGDGLERVALREGDDGDGIPVIADAELAVV